MPLVLLGPRIPHDRPQFLGGTVVLFENLVSECEARDVDLVVLDTNKKNYTGKARFVAHIARRVLRLAGPDTTFCVCSSQDWRVFLPIIQSICAVRGGRVFLRMFGGDFQIRQQARNPIAQRVVRRLMSRCEAVFVETPPLVDYVSDLLDTPVHITVNTRRQTHPPSERSWNKRVVYVGHVWDAKGIPDLIAAKKRLPDDWHFAVYGPILAEHMSPETFTEAGMHYGGILDPDDVQPTMDQYDVFAFPTWAPGEGYPGVIIEAMAQGLPIISSQWREVPDCVRHEVNGLLFPMRDVDAFVAAFERIDDPELYAQLSAGSLELFERFTPDAAITSFLDVLGVG